MTRTSRAAIVAALALLGALVVADPAAALSTVPNPHPSVRPTAPDRTAAQIRSSTGDDAIHVPGAASFTDFAHKPTSTRRTNSLADGGNDGVERVWVSIASATSKTSDDVNTNVSQSTVASLISSLNSYWSAQSGGAVSVELGGYETRSIGSASCNPNSVFSSEENNAFDGQFSGNDWFGTHDHLLVLSREACGNQSFATVGGDGGEIFSGNGATGVGVTYLLHEFGHNLGFEHADASTCETSTTYDAPISSFGFTSTTCPTTEYDDYLDIMGYTVTGATPNLSSPQRILAGWLSGYQTATRSVPVQTVTLSPLGGSTGIRALKVVDPNSDDVYYVEYRAPQGLDKTSAEFRYQQNCGSSHGGYQICNLGSSTANGVVRILRELPFSNLGVSGTTVMATGTVSGSKTKRVTRMNTGQTFTNYDDGFSLTLNSVSIAHGASVTVSYVHPAATTTNIAVAPGRQTYATDDPATATVTVDSVGSEGAPTGTVTLYDGSTKLGSTVVGDDGTASLSLPPSLKVGTHKITARFAPTSLEAKPSASKTVSVTVAKAASTTSLVLSSATAANHHSVKATVTVETSGVAGPSGTLQFYLDGKKSKKVTLSSKSGGVISVTLPQFGRTGNRSIHVDYQGSSTVAGSKSGSLIVRVEKS